MNDILIGYAIISAIVAILTFVICAENADVEPFPSAIGKTVAYGIFWGPILVYLAVRELWRLARNELRTESNCEED